MPSVDSLVQKIQQVHTGDQFAATALEVFHYQYEHNRHYGEWVDFLKKDIGSIKHYSEIPFLPISLFKSHKIKSFEGEPEVVFKSSGTTGMQQSHHYVRDLELYRWSYLRAFKYFYGNIEDYTVLALLPSYLEREGSSLVMMADDLIKRSRYSESGFYLHNYEDLYRILLTLKEQSRKVILLGVSFALLEFAEKYRINSLDLIVMETGGMKGKRKELLRDELHQILKKSFGVKHIHSEYGMTELLSQAYSKCEGVFYCPPWMKVLVRDTNDPMSLLGENKSGGINVIDLSNLHSCSFIATQDLGKIHSGGAFEILGRFDHSDIRGCNLLVM